MTTRRLLGAIIGVGVGLAGCDRTTTAPAELPAGQVVVGPGTVFALPAPAALQRTVEAQQLVTARYTQETFTFEALVSVNPARLLAVVTDTLGRQAMSAEWDGRAMRVDKAPWAPPELRADNLIADIMLVHWPRSTVRAGLRPPAAMETSRPRERVIATNGGEVIRIEHLDGSPASWTGHWSYRNLAWRYDLDIRSAEAVP